ncbi:unnamed protein product [Somion occarium]|uniref:Uncharacterized protein n=1 Tax=Somion occarium TaxID=3059160 RepID=A0ABP1CEU2_9APHY
MPQDDDLVNPGLRRPADWDALHALESLSPPSPSTSLSEEDSTSLCSIGEITILLHDGVKAGLGLNLRDVTTGPLSESNLMLPSVSMETCGTFGPRHMLSSGGMRHSLSLTFADCVDNATSMSTCFTQPSVEETDTHRISVLSQFTVSAYLAPEMQRRNTSLNPSGSDWTLPASPTYSLSAPGTQAIKRLKSKEGLSRSAPTTPRSKFAALRSLSSVSSSIISAITNSPPRPMEPIDWATTLASIPARKARWFPPEIPESFPPFGDACSGKRIIAPNDSPDLLRYPEVITGPVNGSSKQDYIPSRYPPSNGSSVLARCSGSPQGSSSPSLRSVASFVGQVSRLPQALSWLQDVDLEFWIDQEYRILPDRNYTRSTMTLMGYTASEHTMFIGEPDPLLHAIAEFKPAIRQSFTFHYHSALDSLPLLKRIVTLGDDPKDCISRQAFLSLKTNGVYFVSGTEVYDLTPSVSQRRSRLQQKPTKEQPKLAWRFEYLVNDFRDANNEIVPEQKSVTPLSFTCSPGLLHTSHGKKNNRMFDLLRKSLLPKITSEKLQAPKPPRYVLGLARTGSQDRPTTSSPAAKPSQGIFRNAVLPGHGKMQSQVREHASKHKRYHSTSAGIVIQGRQEYRAPQAPLGMGIPTARKRPMRKRAVSIAGLADVTATDRQPISHVDEHVNVTSTIKDRRRSVTAPVFKVVRHIVPPAELDGLVSVPQVDTRVDPRTGFTSLKPPTYHARQRRVPSPLHVS